MAANCHQIEFSVVFFMRVLIDYSIESMNLNYPSIYHTCLSHVILMSYINGKTYSAPNLSYFSVNISMTTIAHHLHTIIKSSGLCTFSFYFCVFFFLTLNWCLSCSDMIEHSADIMLRHLFRVKMKPYI